MQLILKAIYAVVLAGLALSCTDPTTSARPETPAQFSLAEASDSTLRVVAFGSDISAGSGVAISENFVLTNLHVVQIARDDPQATIYVWDDSAGFPRPVSGIVEVDPRLDLAVLYVRGIASEPVRIAISAPRQLEEVTALGFPASTDMVFGRLRASVSATSGQVTAVDEGTLGEYGPVDLILHTATLNPGSSGGPLFNACGELVGVNTLKADPAAASNVFVSSAPSEIVGFLQSYEIPYQSAEHVCSATSAPPACSFDSRTLDEAITQKDLRALERQIQLIPDTCADISTRAWRARQDIANEAIARFLEISGTWRLDDQQCDDRMWLTVSGLAVWGRAGDRVEVERFVSVDSNSVTTRTSFPESAGSDTFAYSLNDDRLTIRNTTDNTSWEMIRCTG